MNWFSEMFGLSPARSVTVWYGCDGNFETSGNPVIVRLTVEEPENHDSPEDSLLTMSHNVIEALGCRFDSVEDCREESVYVSDKAVLGRFHCFREELN